MRLLRLLSARAIKMASFLGWLMLALAALPAAAGFPAPGNTPWDQPAAALADQISATLGPGQAHLTLRNLSSIAADDLPAIRRVLEQDLGNHGITLSSDEAANQLRITLSENAHERIWVAEVIEGTETRIAMVTLNLAGQTATQNSAAIALHKQTVFTSWEPIVAALEVSDGLIIL